MGELNSELEKEEAKDSIFRSLQHLKVSAAVKHFIFLVAHYHEKDQSPL